MKWRWTWEICTNLNTDRWRFSCLSAVKMKFKTTTVATSKQQDRRPFESALYLAVSSGVRSVFVKQSEPSRCLLGQLIGQSTHRPRQSTKTTTLKPWTRRSGRKVLHGFRSGFILYIFTKEDCYNFRFNGKLWNTRVCIQFVHEPKGLVVLSLRSMQQIDMQIDW